MRFKRIERSLLVCSFSAPKELIEIHKKKHALDLLHKAKQNQVMMKTMMYKKDGFVFVILRINLLKTVRKQQLWSSHFFHFFLQNTLQHQQSKDSTLNAKYARFFKPGRDPEKARKRALYNAFSDWVKGVDRLGHRKKHLIETQLGSSASGVE